MARDVIGGAAAVVLGFGYLYLALQLRASALADHVGPAGVPKMLAVLMIGLGAILIVRTLIGKGAPDPAAAEDRPGWWRQLWRAAGLLLIGIAYLVVVPYLGYGLSIALLIIAVAAYQGVPINLRLAAIGGGGALVLWLIFVWLLHVRMPAGVLELMF